MTMPEPQMPQAHQVAYSQEDLRRIVQETLAPGLRRSQAR
jgi:hypothetical protein